MRLAENPAKKYASRRNIRKESAGGLVSYSMLIVPTLRKQAVFRTAYAVAKMNMTFTSHRDLLTLQEANGLEEGKVHRSDHSCAKIIIHISKQMKITFCERLKSLAPHVAVMLDESTLYRTSVIAVYLRTRLADITEEQTCGSRDLSHGLETSRDSGIKVLVLVLVLVLEPLSLPLAGHGLS